jgi:hypothetical protein
MYSRWAYYYHKKVFRCRTKENLVGVYARKKVRGLVKILIPETVAFYSGDERKISEVPCKIQRL